MCKKRLPELMRIIRTKLPVDVVGVSLIDYLMYRFTYQNEVMWRCRFKEGRLALDGIQATPEVLLTEGMLLTFDATGIQEPNVDLSLQIIAETDDYLLINKPPNLPVHPAGAYFNHTVWGEVQRRGHPPIYCVNRLDRETSGLVLCAKTSQCVSSLARQITEKRYRVLIHGIFPKEPFYCMGFLQSSPPTAQIRKQQIFTNHTISAEHPHIESFTPNQALTSFRVIQQYVDYAEIEATLYTGRLHQIRATLHALGYPIIGDKIYGLNPSYFLRFIEDQLSEADWRALRLPSQALHASELVLNGKRFTAPCPVSWERLLQT